MRQKPKILNKANIVFILEQSNNKKNTVSFKKGCSVKIILETNRKRYSEKVESADDVLKGLDKILKKSRMEITSVKNIKTVSSLSPSKSKKVDKFCKKSYTSCRIVKSVEKAIKFYLNFN